MKYLINVNNFNFIIFWMMNIQGDIKIKSQSK